MFTVEKIEENIVELEDRKTKNIIEITKEELPDNLNEGMILDFIDNKYVINTLKTKNIKENIRNRFNNLKK